MRTTSFKKMLMAMMAVVALAACSKGGQDRSARPISGGTLGPSGNGGGTTCGNSQQTVGRIFDSAGLGASASFEQRVKALLSASADPNAFGTISGSANDPQTGVTLEGRFRYDNSGNIVLDQSNISITIYDSYVGQKDSAGNIVESYPITFTAASGGHVDVTTKSFTLQFKDSYGELNFTGRIEGANVTGTISFQNYVGYNNSAPLAGVLGVFTIPTCAFVN